MKNRLISLILVVSLVFTGAFPLMVFAEEPAEAGDSAVTAVEAPSAAEVEKSMKVITDAISKMNKEFPDPDYVADLIKVFENIGTIAKSVSSIASAIDGSISFLTLIGVMKDPQQEALMNIAEQMQIVSDRIKDMDQKLDRITDEMVKFQAHTEFNIRTDRAIAYHNKWTDFRRDYMEKGMDSLMNEFEAMVRDGLKAWCQNRTEKARYDEDVDNTRVILLYEKTEEGYDLRFSAENDVPEEYLSEGRYLILSEEFLPESIVWNINTYRDAFIDYVSGKIREKRDAGEWDAFECGNFPAFTEEGSAELTDELAETVAEEALNTLSYRISCIEVNRSSAFPMNVLESFELYCMHLNDDNDGIDAICKSLYFTHAFEYEITDTFNDICNQMILRTGVYGTFVMDVIGMSRSIKDSEKDGFMQTYCDALDALKDVQENGLTGYPRFSYLTGTEMIIGKIAFRTEATIHTSRNVNTNNYESCWASPTTLSRTYLPGEQTTAPLIGDSNMQLLSYTMQSNGQKVDFDFLNEHIKDRYREINYDKLVTSVQPEITLPSDTAIRMEVTNVYGDYFKNESTVSLNSLPGDAESKYIQYAKMIKGGVFNYDSGEISSNQILHAIALYGESHTLWFTDETAFLGGPPRDQVGIYWPFVHGVDEVYAGTSPLSNYKYYDFEYWQHSNCNTIYLVSLPPSFWGEHDHDPLLSYLEEAEDIKKNNRTGLFEDVKGSDWFFDAVEWAVQAGITTGTDETHFTPAGQCTRGQTVTFLWRAAGQPETVGAPSFSDVEDGAYYASAVKWAASKGVVNGRSESVFDPDGLITREELAAILFRYARSRGEEPAAPSRPLEFTDAGLISSWAMESLSWCVDKSIMQGMGGNRIEPKGNATRAQIVTMLNRYLTAAEQAE